MPVYGLAFNLAQLVVLCYGIYLIAAGAMTVGLLIGFLLYVNSFYLPLRQVAMLWSSFQLALAAVDRISEVLGARIEHAGRSGFGRAIAKVGQHYWNSRMCSSVIPAEKTTC